MIIQNAKLFNISVKKFSFLKLKTHGLRKRERKTEIERERLATKCDYPVSLPT